MASSDLIPTLAEECLAVLDDCEPGPMLRLLVREALVDLWASGRADEAALAFLRQLEFATDRVELVGIEPVRAILAQTNRRSRRRTTLPAQSGMRHAITSGPPSAA